MAKNSSPHLTADNKGIWETIPQTFVDLRVETILAMLPGLGPRAEFLDIGCLDGTLTRLYANKVGTKRVHGIDVALVKGADKKDIEAVEFDLNSRERLPYEDARFDVIAFVETLEHVYPTDHILREIFRILKPDGIAIIDVPRLDSFLNIALLTLGFQPPGIECSRERRYGAINQDSVLTGHVAYFTRRALLEMLRSSGFKILEARQVGQRSGWIKLQESQGKRVSAWVRFLWWFYDLVSLKKEYMVVKVQRAA